MLEASYEAAPRLAAALVAALRLEARPVAAAAAGTDGATEGEEAVEVQTRLMGTAWPAETEVGPEGRGEAETKALTSRERDNPCVHLLRWRPRHACAHVVHLFYGECEVMGSPLTVPCMAHPMAHPMAHHS